MKKRILSLLLCAALALPGAGTALAAVKDVPQQEKAAVLRELEIMVGDETGALHLERTVTRAEFTKLLIAASTYKDMAGQNANTDPYPDVSYRAWYAPYVRAAVDAGFVRGDEAGWFHPQATITLQEGATMAVRLLGYQDGDFAAPWPAGQMGLYHSLDLDQGVTAKGDTDPLTRQDCLHIFYNLLCANNKSGQSYVNLLGHTLNADGEVDVPALFQVEQEGPIPLTGAWRTLLPFDADTALVYRDGERSTLAELREYDLLYWAEDQAILFASSDAQGSMGALTASVDGPVVAQGDWQSQLPFPLSEASSITRNGLAATAGDIKTLDVVYWSEYTKAVTVYAKTAWGTVEAITPSLASPTAVVVAGVTYPLETFQAQYAFSDLGQFRKGDSVLLLLGRTGGVAAVQSLDTRSDLRQVGVVSALGSATYTDDTDNAYARRTVTFTATDGRSYTYPYAWKDADDLPLGSLVEVTVTDGQAKVARLSRRSITGVVSQDAAQKGGVALSPEVEILDTYGETVCATVAPARLAGVRLSGDMVRYVDTDENGAVTALILDNVTGDLHRYGILTDLEVVNSSMLTQSVLTFDLGGSQQVIPVNGKTFPVREGPACLMMDGQTVKNARSLTKLQDVSLEGYTAVADDTAYPLADNTAYYIYSRADDLYTLSTRAQVLAGNYSLSAWYDTAPERGGRVRVILAEGL